jgi:hypothetical protein
MSRVGGLGRHWWDRRYGLLFTPPERDVGDQRGVGDVEPRRRLDQLGVGAMHGPDDVAFAIAVVAGKRAMAGAAEPCGRSLREEGFAALLALRQP